MKKNIFFLSLLLLQTSCFATNSTPTFNSNTVSIALEKLSQTELELLVQQAKTMLDQDSLPTFIKNSEQEQSARILHKFNGYHAAALGIVIIVSWLLWPLQGVESSQLIMKECFEYGSLRFCDTSFDIGNHCFELVECVTNLGTNATICSKAETICLSNIL
ncbi:hypothetical protein K2W90_00140 [Candidatus Babeliales bacterium]|nr:hypothetical protein [Candidatus Babeliales bacterium]